MPRQARQIVDGGCYHIITRGNNRKRLFRIRSDFVFFKKIIKEELAQYAVCVHNYCIMHNHLHFLIKAQKGRDVPIFFKHILQRYAIYFRKRYKHTGYLFQNRYKSLTIEKDSYLLECARYIERNPVRAGIVANAEGYPWSSCLHYTKGKSDDIISHDNPIYIGLSDDAGQRESLYAKYINEDRPYEHIVAQGLGM